MRAFETIDEILQLNEKNQALFDLFKLILKILLYSHFLACSWHAIGYYSPFSHTILEPHELSHKNWLTKYLNCLFWTVAPEKIEPHNNLEFAFGFFALLISEIVLGFILDSVHLIMENLGKLEHGKK